MKHRCSGTFLNTRIDTPVPFLRAALAVTPSTRGDEAYSIACRVVLAVAAAIWKARPGMARHRLIRYDEEDRLAGEVALEFWHQLG